MEWLRKVLRFPAEIIVADSINIIDYKEIAEDNSDKWRPNNFQAGDILVKYPQVFEDRIGFQPNLGVLDLLFNMGPSAIDLLQS